MAKFKFKKGDRVRRIDVNFGKVIKGRTYKVYSCSDDGLVLTNNTEWSYSLASFVLVKTKSKTKKDIKESSSTKDKKASKVGLRFNQGKLPLDQVPPSMEKAFALVAAHGEKKYTKHNWRKGMSWADVYGCARRHMQAWFKGEELDDCEGGSNLPHLYHALWNIAALIEYQEKQIGLDDRWHKSQPAKGDVK